MKEGKGEFHDMVRMSVFIWQSYPSGTNGKLCVHGCLVAPLYEKINPNVMQAVHLEKGKGKKYNLPEIGQSVYHQKKDSQTLAKICFQLTGKTAFRHFHFL